MVLQPLCGILKGKTGKKNNKERGKDSGCQIRLVQILVKVRQPGGKGHQPGRNSPQDHTPDGGNTVKLCAFRAVWRHTERQRPHRHIKGGVGHIQPYKGKHRQGNLCPIRQAVVANKKQQHKQRHEVRRKLDIRPHFAVLGSGLIYNHAHDRVIDGVKNTAVQANIRGMACLNMQHIGNKEVYIL